MKLNMKPVLLCIGISIFALQAQAQELPEAAPAPETGRIARCPIPKRWHRKKRTA